MEKYKNKVANSVFKLNFVLEIVLGIAYGIMALSGLFSGNIAIFFTGLFIGIIIILSIHIYFRVIPEILEKLHLIEEHLNEKTNN